MNSTNEETNVITNDTERCYNNNNDSDKFLTLNTTVVINHTSSILIRLSSKSFKLVLFLFSAICVSFSNLFCIIDVSIVIYDSSFVDFPLQYCGFLLVLWDVRSGHDLRRTFFIKAAQQKVAQYGCWLPEAQPYTRHRWRSWPDGWGSRGAHHREDGADRCIVPLHPLAHLESIKNMMLLF